MPAYTNARQTIPEVFTQVMRNDQRRERLRDLAVNGEMTQGDWRELGELTRDRKNLRGSAEKALRWNTDKGALG